MFEGLWEFRAVHPPLLSPRNAWGAWKGVLRAGGILRGSERGVRAGPGGVSQGSSAPIVRPGSGPTERSARRWSRELRARAPASARPGSARREAGREPAAAPRSERGGTWGAAALPGPSGSGARRYLRAKRGPGAGWGHRADLDRVGPRKGARAGHRVAGPRRGPTRAIPDPALIPQGSPRGLRSAPFFSSGVWVPQ